MSTPTIDVRRSADRFHTEAGWLDSRHSFSFGRHYDPANTHHGLLLVSNDDRVDPGTRLRHPPPPGHGDRHLGAGRRVGARGHRSATGASCIPGLAQRMSAGTGIWHSEKNPSGGEPVHFVQMWVVPDTESVEPGYEQLDVNTELDRGGLVAVASGQGHDAAIRIHQRDAVLWGGWLTAGRDGHRARRRPRPRVRRRRLRRPRRSRRPLAEGDAVRLTGAGSPRLTAGEAGRRGARLGHRLRCRRPTRRRPVACPRAIWTAGTVRCDASRSPERTATPTARPVRAGPARLSTCNSTRSPGAGRPRLPGRRRPGHVDLPGARRSAGRCCSRARPASARPRSPRC